MTASLRGRASIVIPVFNQVFFTMLCLRSLEPEQDDAEIVVVDNGSSDQTPKVLADWAAAGANRRYVTIGENLGFARGCNAGAHAAEREFLVFLNNDTVVTEGWLEAILEPFIEDDKVMITGSRLLYPSGHIQHAGVAFDADGPHHVFVGMPGDSPVATARRDFQVVTGASLAIRADEFRRQGGFDDAFKNSFEDVDLCLRVRRDGGRVVYAPDSVAYHFESMSDGRLGPSDMRNYNLFMSRWAKTFVTDLTELEREAVEAGVDLAKDRVPSRREVIDAAARTKDLEARVRGLEAHASGLEAEITGLKALLSRRSVRLTLWARDHLRLRP